MRVEYSNRAIADLHKMAAQSHSYGVEVAEAVEQRFHHITDHIRREPESAQSVEGRPGVRVIPLVKYPYRIFYRLTGDAARILHIHHTSRRPW